jgi:peptidyl-prolyl cis-trans isomerase SurA
MTFSKRNLLLFLSILLFTTVVLITSCSSKRKQVVAEIGDDKIYLYDFEKQYLKTVGNEDTARNKSLDEKKDFLNLLIKFRLKVKDGRDRGLLNTPEIQTEINDFRKKYISEFLIDKEMVEPIIKKVYDRKKYDVRISYIMVKMKGPSGQDDTMKAYQKCDDIVNRLKNGDDFMTVAKDMTEEESFAQTKGDTYYISAGMTPPDFEDAVFDLKVGEFTKKPIKAQNSLFILKCTDKVKKEYSGIRIAHILVADKKDSTGKVIDSLETLKKAQDFLAQLKSDNFEKLADSLSEDPGTKGKGGDLGIIDNRRRLPPEIDSVVFLLKVGQNSELVRSQFGWHIFKVTDKKDFESFDKQRESLKSEFKRNMQYKPERAKFIEKIFKDYNFEINIDALNSLAVRFDSTKTIAEFNLDSMFTAQDKSMELAKYKNGVIKLEDVIQYLSINKDFSSNAALYTTIKRIIEGAGENPILTLVAEKNKIDKDEDYVDMLTEYENGLLSFKIDQEELWSKIKITEDNMLNYYNTNKEKFTTVDSTGIKVYKTYDDVKGEISNTLQQDKFKELEITYVEGLKQKYPVKIHDNILEKAFAKK